jgi:hypothetical protein
VKVWNLEIGEELGPSLDGWQEMIFFAKFSLSTAFLAWQPKIARHTLGDKLVCLFETCNTTPANHYNPITVPIPHGVTTNPQVGDSPQPVSRHTFAWLSMVNRVCGEPES